MALSTNVQLMFCNFFVTWTLVMTNEILHLDTGVVVNDNITKNVRVRRQVHRDMVGFNIEQKYDILQRHNILRSKSQQWDTELEKLAYSWAQQCKFVHSSNRKNVAGYSYVGENLYAGTGEFDPASVVQAWYDEITDYDYNTQACTGVCGHYTQVVWASSQALGCSVKYCNYLEGASEFGFNSGYNYVCHYAPGGNYRGQRPFIKGKACSQCPEETEFCVRHMCAQQPQLGSGSHWIQNSKSHLGLLFLSVVTLQLLQVK
uniref:SCP domain-containing protein n=1 Tax=Arion vulgaris TaxID=1028688 RepID=A0A0B6ZFA6_9EUPU